jgi:hypothetical protein
MKQPPTFTVKLLDSSMLPLSRRRSLELLSKTCRNLAEKIFNDLDRCSSASRMFEEQNYKKEKLTAIKIF